MRYLSLFSGIEAASAAWGPLGWEPVAFAETDPFPSAVLAHHYPDVPNLGDVTAVDWEAWKAENGSPDVLIAGSPCQAFSVAGHRRGLEDARGNLSLFTAELVRLLEPRFFLWENVPGVLSDKTNALGCLVGEIVGAGRPVTPPGGRWTDAGLVSGPERRAAWRVLDAQFFGVAQRRRRLFVVACPAGGADPAEVLLEWEGLQRHTPPGREAGQVAPTIPARRSGGGGLGTDFDCDGGLRVAHTLRGEGFDGSEDGTGRGTPLVADTLTASYFNGMTVRRLTPRECERLQGFPDDHTRIPQRTYSRKRVTRLRPEDRWEKNADGTWTLMAADGPRYKAIGNSMAVPVIRWIGERIEAVLEATTAVKTSQVRQWNCTVKAD